MRLLYKLAVERLLTTTTAQPLHQYFLLDTSIASTLSNCAPGGKRLY